MKAVTVVLLLGYQASPLYLSAIRLIFLLASVQSNEGTGFGRQGLFYREPVTHRRVRVDMGLSIFFIFCDKILIGFIFLISSRLSFGILLLPVINSIKWQEIK